MKKMRLNGRFMNTKARAHRHLKRRLRLPAYYGNNLDALYDCLCAIGEPTEITLRHADWLEALPDGYGKRIASVFLAATGANPNLTIVKLDGR